jgi:hypothetical protein
MAVTSASAVMRSVAKRKYQAMANEMKMSCNIINMKRKYRGEKCGEEIISEMAENRRRGISIEAKKKMAAAIGVMAWQWHQWRNRHRHQLAVA